MVKKAITNNEGNLGLQRCFERALSLGNKIFALQGIQGKTCYTSATAEQTYNKHGPSDKCQEDGRGGFLASEVYEIIAGIFKKYVFLSRKIFR